MARTTGASTDFKERNEENTMAKTGSSEQMINRTAPPKPDAGKGKLLSGNLEGKCCTEDRHDMHRVQGVPTGSKRK